MRRGPVKDYLLRSYGHRLRSGGGVASVRRLGAEWDGARGRVAVIQQRIRLRERIDSGFALTNSHRHA